ncbi:MAG TPA: energy transducer TonB [Terriglobales bacterium]|jgi:TonB family protein|nr:energy transducer TonB [Terriglobales bacterium]
MRIVLLVLLCATLLHAETPAESDLPALVKFVAPAYPRLAKDNRIMGTTETDMTINADGRVGDVKIISAHPVFAKYVLSALKQWQFKASQTAFHLTVTVQFDQVDDCSDGTDKHPLTSETYVSAELPRIVHVRTAARCMETSNSYQRQ